jgi:hypothetical protein
MSSASASLVSSPYHVAVTGSRLFARFLFCLQSFFAFTFSFLVRAFLTRRSIRARGINATVATKPGLNRPGSLLRLAFGVRFRHLRGVTRGMR